MNYLFTTFEDYLRGSLSDQEQVELEAQLQSDKSIKKDFELFKSMRTQLSKKFNSNSNSNSSELLDVLGGLGSKYFVEGNNDSRKGLGFMNRSFRPYLISIAASLLFLMAAGFGLKQYANNVASGEAIVKGMKALGVEKETMRSSSENRNTFVLPGFDEFKRGKYKEALLKFEGIDASSIHYNDKFMFAGEAYLQSKQYDKAIIQFSRALETGTENFAKWNLARTFILAGDKTQAGVYLNEIIKDGSDQILKERSEKVLNKLNGFMYKLSYM